MALEQFKKFNSDVNENYYYNGKTPTVVKAYMSWGQSMGKQDVTLAKVASMPPESALNNPAPGLDELISFCENEIGLNPEQTMNMTR